MSFARFMELALYHPAFGYYRRPADPFGSHGDFFTAEQLRPFADLIAACAERFGARQVLELGAGRRDLRHALAPWNYRGLDWDDPCLATGFSGLVLANEFFDALPVHLLQRSHGEWSELAVDYADRFVWRRISLTSPQLLEYAERYGSLAPDGATLEVNLAMTPWLDRLALSLRDAQLLIIDYGYDAAELRRLSDGTLLSYRKHTAHADVLRRPGEFDITAHVNFTELLRLAEARGFQVTLNTSLRNWALALSQGDAFEEQWRSADRRWRLEWKQLLFGMGETFRVILMQKDSEASPPK